MDVSKLVNVLSSINSKEVILSSSNGTLVIYSESEGFETYAEVDSEISLPKIKVDIKQLLEALKIAQWSDLKLTYADSKLTLKTSIVDFEMGVRESEVTFLTIPGDECFEEIDFQELKTAFSKVIGAVGKDKLRPQLQVVNIDGGNIMATNSFMMSVYDMEQMPNTFKDIKFTLDGSFVKELLKAGKKERVAGICLTDSLFFIKLGDITYIGKKDYPYRPNYKPILEGALQADNKYLVNTDDLKRALKGLKPTLIQTQNYLKLSLSKDKTLLNAGNFTLEIASVSQSEPCRVTLNSEYVETFLKTAGSTTNIAVKNEFAPVVLTTDDSNYNFVIMPIRA